MASVEKTSADVPSEDEPASRCAVAVTAAGTEIAVAVAESVEAPAKPAWVADRVMAALDSLSAGPAGGRIEMTLLDDGAIAPIHEKYRGETGPTDVLSFDLRDAPSDAPEGDVLVNAEQAVREAVRRGWPPDRELLLYAVHGALHLIGHDDEEPEAAERMRAQQDALLAAVLDGAASADDGARSPRGRGAVETSRSRGGEAPW